MNAIKVIQGMLGTIINPIASLTRGYYLVKVENTTYFIDTKTRKIDYYTTWLNNSKFSWIIPVICLILVGLVEGM